MSLLATTATLLCSKAMWQSSPATVQGYPISPTPFQVLHMHKPSNSLGSRIDNPFIDRATSTSRRASGTPWKVTCSIPLEQGASKKEASSSAIATAKETFLRPQSERLSNAIDPDDSVPSPSESKTNNLDSGAWRAPTTARRTTRRRALVLCSVLALGTFRVTHRQHQVDNSAAAVRTSDLDLITVSRTAEGARDHTVPTESSVWKNFGDLVTVSTGSPDTSTDGTVRGLPSWMRGNYHLCMGDGFHIQLPADWHMYDTQGQLFGTVLRYEDKAEPSTNVIVLKSPTSHTRTDDLGAPEDWIRNQAYLLTGSNEPLQFQAGEEGTDAAQKFPRGRVSIAKVLNVHKPRSKQGLTYYTFEIITKQGGKQEEDSLHELVSAVVNNGNLYMCRVQTEQGRWQQSTRNMAQRIIDSFQITGFKIHV